MYRVGIDLGGTNIKVGIVDENNQILAQDSVPTKVERPYQEVIKDMADLINKLSAQLNISQADIVGIGMGSPGLIDAASGIVRYANNFGWENIPAVEELHKYFDCKIAISNDANCAALGEVEAGAAREYKNALLLTLGTGLGGGVIMDGKIFEGGHAGGAELGHTCLICGGELCTCGRRGCIEAYVSATALIRDTKKAAQAHPDSKLNELCGGDYANIDGKTAFDGMRAGDEVSTQVVKQYITFLGETITDFVNIFRPDIVLLSGGICNEKNTLTDPLNEYIKEECYAKEKAFIPPVVCATLKNNAGIIGAAHLTDQI